jgi:hypothetical protein
LGQSQLELRELLLEALRVALPATLVLWIFGRSQRVALITSRARCRSPTCSGALFLPWFPVLGAPYVPDINAVEQHRERSRVHLDGTPVAGHARRAKPPPLEPLADSDQLERSFRLDLSGRSDALERDRSEATGDWGQAGWVWVCRALFLRIDGPPSLSRWALWTSRSQMASAIVGSPSASCQVFVGICVVTTVDVLS